VEKERTGERGMGVGYKGSQGQTERTVELQEADREIYKKWVTKSKQYFTTLHV
jgi:hypothetical protein